MMRVRVPGERGVDREYLPKVTFSLFIFLITTNSRYICILLMEYIGEELRRF